MLAHKFHADTLSQHEMRQAEDYFLVSFMLKNASCLSLASQLPSCLSLGVPSGWIPLATEKWMELVPFYVLSPTVGTITSAGIELSDVRSQYSRSIFAGLPLHD